MNKGKGGSAVLSALDVPLTLNAEPIHRYEAVDGALPDHLSEAVLTRRSSLVPVRARETRLGLEELSPPPPKGFFAHAVEVFSV